MTTTRITISVPQQVAAKAQRAVDAGEADSVSGYFSGLAEREPDWVAAREVIDEMIEEIGGLPPEAEQWADEVINRAYGGGIAADGDTADGLRRGA